MQITFPSYYKKFSCIADACPDTCCAGWQIMIDDKSLSKYRHFQGSFRNRLHNDINWKEHAFRQYGHRCAFLNEENLCDLYKALGPDSLCDTCRMYPRHTEEYEGLRELSLSLSCPEAARIILSCKEPVRFLEEEDDLEDDFEEFDLEDTRDVLFSILQDRSLPLTLRMSASEQLTEQYQIRVEEQKEYEIDELLRNCEAHHQRKKLQEFVSESLAEKGIDAASLHRWARQIEELQVLRGLERLRPEWDDVLDGAEKWLYQGSEETYHKICEEFHKAYGSLGSHKEEWENLGEQLLMFFVYTYFCGAVYDDMVCSKIVLCPLDTGISDGPMAGKWKETFHGGCGRNLLEICPGSRTFR